MNGPRKAIVVRRTGTKLGRESVEKIEHGIFEIFDFLFHA